MWLYFNDPTGKNKFMWNRTSYAKDKVFYDIVYKMIVSLFVRSRSVEEQMINILDNEAERADNKFYVHKHNHSRVIGELYYRGNQMELDMDFDEKILAPTAKLLGYVDEFNEAKLYKFRRDILPIFQEHLKDEKITSIC